MSQSQNEEARRENRGPRQRWARNPHAAERRIQQLEEQLETARRLAAELTRTNEEWERVFASLPDMVAMLDDHYRIMRVNTAMAEQLGVTAEACVGKICYEVVHGTNGPPPFCPHARLLRDGREHVVEIAEERLGGDLLVSATPLPADGVRPTTCLHIARDISERKRMEKLLAIQRDLATGLSACGRVEEGLRLCLEAALSVSGLDCGGVYLVDADSGDLRLVHHRHLSAAFVASARHYPADSPAVRLVMKGVPVYALHETLGVPVDDVRREEKLRAIALIPVHHKGRVVACLCVASHTLDEVPALARSHLEVIAAQSGGPLARLQAEARLRESEERYRELVENASDLIYTHDLEGNLLWANAAACRLLGYEADEVGGLKLDQVVDSRYLEVARQALGGKGEGQELSAPYELMLRNRGGAPVWVEVSSRLHRRDGRCLVMGIARDITERKRLEEQLQVRQRMDFLGTLASGIAHDFNNLLTGIMGNLSMLEMARRHMSPDDEDCLHEAIRGCERAAALIRQLQLLARGASGTEDRKDTVDLCAVTEEVFGLLRQTTERLIEKRNTLTRGEFHVAGDRSQLHQVLLNLVTNAIQAIEERGAKPGDYVQVRARVRYLEDGEVAALAAGEYVELSVEDTGVGIADAFKGKIFDPYFTTKRRSDRGRGSGLGLAMVYNIVTRSHGGHIEVDSEEGRGTTFRLLLRRSSPPGPAPAARHAEVARGDETILVIDDEEVVRRLASRILERHGYTVLAAADGRRGVELYEQHRDVVQAVLLDLTMPVMSGEAVLRKLLEVDPAIRVIISSGHSQEEMDAGIRAQARGFVAKPYALESLLGTLRAVLDAE